MAVPSIKQFKLTNEDEIICEVIEWDTDENSAILIRSALKLIQGVDPDTKIRFFAFRPWMGFQDNPEQFQTLNAGHIIGEANPSEALLKHYAETITEQLQILDKDKKDLPLDEIYGMDEEELEEYLAGRFVDTGEEEELEVEGNVITFPKGTLH
jgi:hypothetical protein